MKNLHSQVYHFGKLFQDGKAAGESFSERKGGMIFNVISEK